MTSELPEDLQAMQRSVRAFARERIAPIAADFDRGARFPWDTLRAMGEMGLLGIVTPERYGGSGLGMLALAVLVEEVSAADASHGTIMAVTNGLPQKLLATHGTDAQRQRWLPGLASGDLIGAFCLSEPHCGSDALAMTTRARRVAGGWRLDGTKAWVTSGGEAQLYLVLAKTEPAAGARGVSAFLVPADADGVVPGRPERKLGQHAAVTTTLTFDGCVLPEESLLGAEGEGFLMAMASLDGGRVAIAAQAVGIGRAAFEAAADYADEREAFGRRIREFQGVSFPLAEMATRLDAARLLTHRAARGLDRGERATREAAMAKLAAGQAASYASDHALQILGAYGYTQDSPVERYFRDARVTRIYEGTDEIQRVVIARQIHRERERGA